MLVGKRGIEPRCLFVQTIDETCVFTLVFPFFPMWECASSLCTKTNNLNDRTRRCACGNSVRSLPHALKQNKKMLILLCLCYATDFLNPPGLRPFPGRHRKQRQLPDTISDCYPSHRPHRMGASAKPIPYILTTSLSLCRMRGNDNRFHRIQGRATSLPPPSNMDKQRNHVRHILHSS